MLSKGFRRTARLVVFACIFSFGVAEAQTAVERNTNAQGVTPVGEYRGVAGMQDNEPTCAINPLLLRNFVCMWNSSGGSDDLIGDTWVRVSESMDSGESFQNRYINGSNLDPLTSVGQDFAADPIMLCWPGGCGGIVIASVRAPGGGSGGGIYMQMMPDMNTEFGFRHALAETLDPVFLSAPNLFADKPYATYILDETNPGTVPVSITIDSPGGGTEVINRDWPKARILVAFALGDPTGNEIKILSTYSDNYGGSWSTPVELTSREFFTRVCDDDDDDSDSDSDDDDCQTVTVVEPQGLNQGVNISAIGDNVLYTYRVFKDIDNPSAIKGIVSTDRGQTAGDPFDIVSPFCAYDVPTLPNTGNTSTVAARTNAFPWTSNNGVNHIMLFAEHQPSSDGGCFTTFDAPIDSRVKAIVGSVDGATWSAPVEIAANAGHGFQFQPVVDCSLGICQAAWWDSRFGSQRVSDYLQNVSTSPLRAEALTAFLNFPVLGDFNYATGPTTVIQFRRTARVLATKIDISSGVPVATDTPPAVVSQYRRALIDGSVREIERDGWNIKAYKTSSVPFMGDYSWLTSAKLRLVFDPATPGAESTWESNAPIDLLNPTKDPLFWISFVTSRNVRGDIYTARITDPVPYDRTPDAMAADVPDSEKQATDPTFGDDAVRAANALEDFNPGAGFCTPSGNPGPGVVFDSLNNRTKDFDIFGAVIENAVSAYSLNPTKTFNIQRPYSIIVENESVDPKSFRLVIVNQPIGFPAAARASWDQLPFDPTAPDFAATPPVTVEMIDVGPMSSESLAMFVVSAAVVNPVAIDIFEQLGGGAERHVNTITVDGVAEDGEFLNADGTANNFEIHNPRVYFPDEFNPDEFNPDEYNPDEFNPDVYTPDEFNPDEFNPDEFNPDEFNPDEFNPDEFNPDEFNPDEFNPDEFNPDEFNAPLIDPGKLDNPEIPDPELGSITGLVSKLDINYGLQNIGNTTTPYTVDFAVVDPEILALLASGELVTQLIAWQDKKIDDVQFCAPREISENRVIAAVNNPDLTVLRIPDINNNRLGALTVTIAPQDVVQFTLRFIAPRATLVPIASKLSSSNISSVFASQLANTGATTLFIDETLIIDDRTPPEFNFITGDTSTFEAAGPLGALVPASHVTASRDGAPVPVVCSPTLPAQVGLDIFNTPMGPTAINCTATLANGVTEDLSLFISVLDRTPPVIDTSTVPADITVSALTAGATAAFVLPTATDAFGVDPDVDVSCDRASGSVFPFTAPGPTVTTVTCTATDDSMFEDTASFTVAVQDVTSPMFAGAPLPDLVIEATSLTGTQVDFTVTASDSADSAPGVNCTPASGSVFALGTTAVNCTATDASNNSIADSFDVLVQDTEPPVVGGIDPPDFEPPLIDKFVLDDDKSTFQLFWGPFTVMDADAMPMVSCNVGILDPARSDPASGLYTFVYDFPIGTTNVSCTATDTQGGTASGGFSVTIFDETPPTITLLGDATITIEIDDPYVDPGVTVTDNATADSDIVVDIDTSALDINTEGTYTVTITASDESMNESIATRTVIVEDSGYPGATGVRPKKLVVRLGSSNGLLWAWLDENGNKIDTSGDTQILRIRQDNCTTGLIVFVMAGDPGTSGFRFKANNDWQFNWQVAGEKGRKYCAIAESSLTGQQQVSPLMTIK